MKLYCDDCQKVFPVQGEHTGNQTACPHCGREFEIPEEHFSPGVVIGDFLIEKPLSKGGMGEVFVARQLSLDRQVALKVLQEKFTQDKEYVESLFNEARAAAKVNHPNIVQAYAVGEEDGVYYFAMELIRGRTFKEILKEEHVIDPLRALQVIRQISGALEAAWNEQKLVHQDIKPENIMVDTNGRAKLADLGLARRAESSDQVDDSNEVLGTPQYISPEQLTGVPTDTRSDIYSLGATFYHLVTGRYPYVADSFEEMAIMHNEGNLQPPKEVNPELPDEVSRIIVKMMARDINARFQSATDLNKALDNVIRILQKRETKKPPELKLGKGSELKRPAAKAAVPALGAARPAAPVIPVAAKPAAPVIPVAAVPEAEPTAPAESEEKTPEKTETPETVTTSSVRQALLDKHGEEKSGEASPDEEIDVVLPKRKNKALLIGGISAGAVLILLLAVFAVCYFGVQGNWLPEAVNPAAKTMLTWFGIGKSPAPAATPQTPVKPKPAEPVKSRTRPEYLAQVENLLNAYRSNPADKANWLAKADEQMAQMPAAVTDEEQKTYGRLVSVYGQVDEIARFAPFRAEQLAQYQARLAELAAQAEKLRLEAERRQQEAEALARAEKLRREQEEKAMKEYAAKLAAEQKARMDKLRGTLDPLAEALLKGAADVILTGKTEKFNTADAQCAALQLEALQSLEEERYAADWKKLHKDLKQAVSEYQAFARAVQDLSKANIAISVTLPNEKGPKSIRLSGIVPGGMLKYVRSGSRGELSLKDPAVRARLLPALKRNVKMDNLDFYTALSAQSPDAVKLAPAVWQTVLKKHAGYFVK